VLEYAGPSIAVNATIGAVNEVNAGSGRDGMTADTDFVIPTAFAGFVILILKITAVDGE
jgi:hypothetical protein